MHDEEFLPEEELTKQMDFARKMETTMILGKKLSIDEI
jgi:hypothetical protein